MTEELKLALEKKKKEFVEKIEALSKEYGLVIIPAIRSNRSAIFADFIIEEVPKSE